MNELPQGIYYKDTPSHGYYVISQARYNKMVEESPALLTGSTFFSTCSRTFEEDLEYNRIVLAFPGEFPLSWVKNAIKVMRDYHPDIYAAHTGRPVKVENSHELQKREHYRINADKWLAICATGDWHEKVPPNYVLIDCILGKNLPFRGTDQAGPTAQFLVKQDTYSARRDGLEYVVTDQDIPLQ